MSTITGSKPLIPPERAVRALAQDALTLMQKTVGTSQDQLEVGTAYLETIAAHVYTPAAGLARVALAVSKDATVSPATKLQAAVKAFIQSSIGVTGPCGKAIAEFGSQLIYDGFQQQARDVAGAQNDIYGVTRAAVAVLSQTDDRIRSTVANASLATSGPAGTQWAAQAAALEASRRMIEGDSLTTTLRSGARQAFDFATTSDKRPALEPFLNAVPTRHI